jgi:hypothetical protein
VSDNRRVVLAATELIASFNVTHYFTLTYPRRMSCEGRDKLFERWLDAIEWLQRRPLGWIRADERRFSGLGFPEIPWHHHGLLIDTDHLCGRTAESIWRSFVGDARVVRYQRNGGAIPYSIKHAFSEWGDWAIGGKALRGKTF